MRRFPPARFLGLSFQNGLIFFLFLLLPARAQQPPPISARVALVSLDVTVTDSRGAFLRGLKPENFRVLDNGSEQRITHFASLEAPAVILVLVETSPAVYLFHGQHLQSAFFLLDGLAPDDQVALASYDQAFRQLLPFTSDKRALTAALGSLRYNLGRAELRFFDAVSAALDVLSTIPGKKTMVLLTTGLDSSSLLAWENLVQRLRSGDVAFFPIALGGDLRDFKDAAPASLSMAPPLSFDQAGRVLRSMADLTGGQAWFPRSSADLPRIYRRLATTLRHRYSLAFEPQVFDARFHRLEVQLRDSHGRLLHPDTKIPSRYRLLTRQGYIAPAP